MGNGQGQETKWLAQARGCHLWLLLRRLELRISRNYSKTWGERLDSIAHIGELAIVEIKGTSFLECEEVVRHKVSRLQFYRKFFIKKL